MDIKCSDPLQQSEAFPDTGSVSVDELPDEREPDEAWNDSDDSDASDDPGDPEEDWREAGGEEAPQSPQPAAPVGDPIKVAIDWIELEGALENNSPELHSFLNTQTGDVIRIFEGSENSDTRLRQAESSPSFAYVEPVSSREQYHWMEEFIEIVEEPTLKDKLNIAIDGKGAFRRFKDVLVGYPVERERWFGKRSEKLRAHIQEWLRSKNVFPLNTPPWEEAPEGEERRDEPRRARPDAAPGRIWREGTADLRSLAHEMIDMIPSRELPGALAFLEFLRGRRIYRRPRYT